MRASTFELGTDLWHMLEDPIGRGSSGHVYAALDPSGHLRALKATLIGGQSPGRTRQPMTWPQLRGVLNNQELFDDPGIQFRHGAEVITSSALRAGDLKTVRDKLHHLSTAQRADIALLLMRDVLPVLAKVHGEQIGHADLKPENILVDGNGHFYLGDTDNARGFADEGMEEIGDFNYMPPEQRRDGRFSAGSDMWSLGVLLWGFVSDPDPERRNNPVRGVVEEYGAWHSALPRVDSRVNVEQLRDGEQSPSTAFGASLMKLPEWLRSIVVNDLVNPHADGRAQAGELLQRLPLTNTDQVLAITAETARGLPTYQRGMELKALCNA